MINMEQMRGCFFTELPRREPDGVLHHLGLEFLIREFLTPEIKLAVRYKFRYHFT
jgi:hypothetical protein